MSKRLWKCTIRIWKCFLPPSSCCVPDEGYSSDVKLKNYSAFTTADIWNEFLEDFAPSIKDKFDRAATKSFIEAATKVGIEVGDVLKNAWNGAIYKVMSLDPSGKKFFLGTHEIEAPFVILLQIKPPQITKKQCQKIAKGIARMEQEMISYGIQPG